MSYRCDICGDVVPRGQPRLVHQVFKTRNGVLVLPRQLAKELACCGACHLMLDELPLRAVKDPYYLRPKHGRDKTLVEVTEQLPAPTPPRPEEVGSVARTISL